MEALACKVVASTQPADVSLQAKWSIHVSIRRPHSLRQRVRRDSRGGRRRQGRSQILQELSLELVAAG